MCAEKNSFVPLDQNATFPFNSSLQGVGPVGHISVFLHDHVVNPARKFNISFRIAGVDSRACAVYNPNEAESRNSNEAVSGLGLMAVGVRS